MPENEKSAENTKRILDIQKLIKKKGEDVALLQGSIIVAQDEIKNLDSKLTTVEGQFDEAQKARDDAITRNNERVLKQVDGERELKSLKEEFENLLSPYEWQLTEMKAKLDKMQEGHCESLKKSMMPCGWSEDDCQAAARNYVTSHPDYHWYQQCQLVLERIRKCEYGTQMEVEYGVIARLSGS